MLEYDIASCCKRLRLSKNIVEMSVKIQADSHQEYLLKLLQAEITHREKARRDKLLKKAGFYTIKTFESFRFDEVTLPSGVTPEYLKECEFIANKTNIVMYGNVGTGKTHLSIALGVEACKKGLEVRFFRTSALVNKLAEQKKAGSLSAFLKTLNKADLLICDEWGYVPLDRVGADMASLKDGNNPKGILLNVTNIKAKEQYIRSEYLNVKKGDSLNLVFLPDQSVLTMEIEIAAMAEQAPLGTEIPRYPYNIQIFISQETFDAIYSGYPQKYRNIQPKLYIRTSDSEELSDQIFLYKDRTSIDEIFVIDYNADHREQRRFLTFVYVFFYGFVALITAICIANIFNTVSTGIQLRKREFGMMLSVGMTPKGFYKMLYYESLFYGVKALLFGLPVSYIIMRLLHRILGRSFEISFSIPWKSVIGAVIVVFAIVGVTMFYSGSKVKDENIMDMLRAENL
jgi:ABC-type antimicrobial peptide transport system permease subunit